MEKGSLEKRDPKEKRPKGEDLKEKEARGERKHEEGSMSVKGLAHSPFVHSPVS